MYNVLQAVNWNVIDKGDTETSLIVVNLSNFYRAVLNKGDDDISVEKGLK
ncbi:MAG: histidine kinase [Oscillospiraceae bacterium]